MNQTTAADASPGSDRGGQSSRTKSFFSSSRAGMLFLKSIRFRLTLWYLSAVVVLLACFGAAAYYMLSFQLHRNLDDSLRVTAAELESVARIEDGIVSFGGQASELVLVFDSERRLLRRVGPDLQFPDIDRLVLRALLGESPLLTQVTPDGQEVRLFATAFAVAPNVRVALVVGKPPTGIEDTLATVRSILGISSLVVIAMAAAGGTVLATRALHPVMRIMGTAENIGEESLSHRIDVNSQDELGRMASSLNSMMERLETAFNRQRQFAADASHELRTPLAVIQAEVSLSLEKERTAEEYRKSLELVEQEISYITAMLSNLLLMARGDAGKEPFNFETVNLRNILTDLSRDVGVLAREKELKFRLGTVDDLSVEGDKVKLRQLFLNILENAVRYTPTGGLITASAVRSQDSAVVSISDTGIGIAPDQQQRIFERFYRVDKARSRAEGGAGLGLGIARFIAEAHGGKIEVQSQVGKGSTFRIVLPLTKAETVSQPL